MVTTGDPARDALSARWLDLTRRRLPAAVRPGWPVRFDHCFQRILLDHACGGRWSDRFDGRPAYAHAPAAVLTRAVDLGEAVLAGAADLAALNRQSLVWRGKRRT
ncbi:GCN5-related N-acetyltransferase [Rhodobacteraceae bacterium CCMM004]|nr:GCN5-related N-acetyltransferase [Rhodobacteraceae bacterium CCMM004]